MPATIAPALTTEAVLGEALADYVARSLLDQRPAVDVPAHMAAYLEQLDYRLVEGHELAALHHEVNRLADLLEVTQRQLFEARCAALPAVAS